MSLEQKKIRIIIDKKGDYTIKTLEGFSGTGCVEQTKNLEVAIGGEAIAEGKTDAYYNSDDDNPVSINLD